jgi:hypothetical protein
MDTITVRHIEIPEDLARYYERYMSVVRHFQHEQDRTAFFTPPQRKFLCDVANALRNLPDPDGVGFFFSEAKKINAVWSPQRGALLSAGHAAGEWFRELLPLPEEPR